MNAKYIIFTTYDQKNVNLNSIFLKHNESRIIYNI